MLGSYGRDEQNAIESDELQVAKKDGGSDWMEITVAINQSHLQIKHLQCSLSARCQSTVTSVTRATLSTYDCLLHWPCKV